MTSRRSLWRCVEPSLFIFDFDELFIPIPSSISDANCYPISCLLTSCASTVLNDSNDSCESYEVPAANSSGLAFGFRLGVDKHGILWAGRSDRMPLACHSATGYKNPPNSFCHSHRNLILNYILGCISQSLLHTPSLLLLLNARR